MIPTVMIPIPTVMILMEPKRVFLKRVKKFSLPQLRKCLKMIQKVRTPAQVFIPYFAKDSLHDYLRLAAQVRAAGLSVEVYPDAKRLGQQLKYADQRGFVIALIAGDEELGQGVCQVKDLRTAESRECSLDNDAAELIEVVKALL